MKIICKTILLSILCFLWLNLSASNRIAIVSDNGDKLPDLLTAELSNVDGIELLDRNEISKVLREQRVNSSIINSRQAFTIGKLLQTDLFVVFQREEKKDKKLIGLIIFDAHTGVRYWDSALPEVNIGKIVNFAVEATKEAISKQQRAESGELQYVSLLSVRNTDLSRTKDYFCQAIGILLLRQLGNSVNFAVLERDYLNWLNKERNLPGMQWSQKLLGANKVLELEITRIGALDQGENQVKCILKSPPKQEIIAIGDLEKPADIATKLGKKFSLAFDKKIELSTTDLQKEAKRFYSEFEILTGHKKYVEALPKIQAADALTAKPVNIRLIRATVMAAADTLDPGKVFQSRQYFASADSIKKSFQFAENGLAMRIQLHQQRPGKIPYHKDGLNDYINKLMGINPTNHYSQDLQNKIKDFNRRFIKFRHEDLKAVFLKNNFKVKDPKSYSTYTEYIDSCQNIDFYESNDHWLEVCYPLFMEWLEITDQYAKKIRLGESCSPSENSCRINRRLAMVLLDSFNNREGLADKNIPKLKVIYERMLNHTAAPMRLSGKAGMLALEGKGKVKGDKYWDYAYQEFIKAGKKEIFSLGNGRKSLFDKENCYSLLNQIYFDNRGGDGITSRIAGLQDILDFMVARNELHGYFATFAIYIFMRRKKYSIAYEYIKKVEQLLNSPNTIIVTFPGFTKNIISQVKKSLAFHKKSLRSLRPEFFKDNDDPPWGKVITIFDGENSKTGLMRIGGAVPAKGKVYAMGLGVDKCGKYFQLLDISYPNVKIKKLGKEYLYWKRQFWTQDDRPIIQACIGNGIYIAATKRHGILIFPLDGGNPIQINTKTGLPVDFVQSIACQNGKIYAGVGRVRQEGYVVSYDIKEKKLTLLASSQRPGNTSPLDNLDKPFYIGGMVSDPDRSRILMFVNFKTGFNPRNTTGIWEYNTQTKTWKNLFSLPFAFFENIRQKGDKLIISSAYWCAEFYPETNKAQLVFSRDKRINKYIKGNSKLIGIKEDYRPPFILTSTYLWSGSPVLNCIDLDTGKRLELPNPNNKQYFQAINIFVPLDNYKYILAADMYSLLLLELNNKKRNK